MIMLIYDLDLHMKETLKTKHYALTAFKAFVYDHTKTPVTASEVMDLLEINIKTLEGMINE